MRIALTHNVRMAPTEEQAEFDSPETIDALVDALLRLGHEVVRVEVSGPVGGLVARLDGLRPDLIFNTAEGASGRGREAFYPALFEQLGIPYTGSDALACAITLDKQTTKRVVEETGVRVPRGRVVRTASELEAVALEFPVIVKPNYEGSSKGVTSRSLVRDADALATCLDELLPRYADGVLVEEFIVGTDVTVPWLEGAGDGGALEPARYDFDVDDVEPGWVIYDYELKNERDGAVSVRCPSGLDAELRALLREWTRRCVARLGIRDVARVDFRVDDRGRPWFLEVNALPSFEPGASLYVAAQRAGLESVDAVLDHVVHNAARRQGVVPRPAPARPRVGLAFNLKRSDTRVDDAEAEYDGPGTIAAITGALDQLGYDVVELEATAALLTSLPSARVDLVFNVAEGVGGRSREAQVPAMLELLGVEYTGSDAATMAVTLDKSLAKSIVRQAGVLAPDGVVVTDPEIVLPPTLGFPVVVKPEAEGSSKGITGTSVATDGPELRALLRRAAPSPERRVLVETYLPGREFTVGLLGHPQVRVLPPMEIVFEDAGEHPVYSYEVKQELEGGVRYQVPAEVDEGLGRELERVARVAFEALGCRDVARIDLRLDAAGRVHFIECNPLPGLTPGYSDLCQIAEAAGFDYASLIGTILAPALARSRAKLEAS